MHGEGLERRVGAAHPVVAKLVWTEEALRWLEDIFEYIAQDNPDAAARTMQGIYDRAQALSRRPRWASGTKDRDGTFGSSSMTTIASRIS